MKKAISLLTIICLLFSIVPIVSAQDIKIGASSYCDFFDASGALCEKGNQEGSVILRSGEWIKFNLKELCLAEGSYELSLSQANVAENAANKKDLVFVDILLDGKLMLKNEMKPTSSVTSFEDVLMGNIYISEGTDYLTIRNSALHSLSVIDVEGFSLVPTDDFSSCDVTYSGLNVISTTEGEGYHDVAAQDFWSNSVAPLGVSCGAVMLHGTGDWVAYDISELPAGAYDITVSSGERVMPKLSIFIDEHEKFSNASVNLSGAYGTYTDTYIGNIYITEKSKVLKIQNLAQATEIRSINLKKVSDGLTIKAKEFDDFKSSNGSLEMTDEGVVVKSKEWIKFDISEMELPKGKYSLSIRQSNNAGAKNKVFLDVLTENGLVLKNKLSASAMVDAPLGIVTLNDNAEFLMLKNSSSHNEAVFEFENVVLTPTKTSLKESFVFEAFNIHSNAEGEGYHDTSGADYWENKNINGTNIASVTTGSEAAVLHMGDWVEHDISDLAGGTYNLKMLSSERLQPIIKITIDGKTYFEGISLSIGGGYGAQYETYTNFGEIFIPDNSQKLRVENLINATYYRSLVLEKTSDKILDSKEFELGIEQVLSETPEEGYHDEDTKDFSDYDFSPEGCVLLHANDWVRYTMENIPSGRYTAYALVQSEGAKLSLSVDETIKARDISVSSKDNKYREFEEIRLGNILVETDISSLKIENTATENEKALIRGIILKTARANQSLKYTSDADGENEIKSFENLDKVYLNGVVEKFDENTETVTIFAALYGEDKLLSFIMEDVEPGSEISIPLPDSDKMSLNNVDSIKTFVWDSVNSPYGDALTIYKGEETVIYVSAENGSDSGDGSKENPFKTIECAKEKVRVLNKEMHGNIKVLLDGCFYIEDTLNFDIEDSGKNGFDVVYEGKADAAIYGGKKITGWKKVDGTELYSAEVHDIDDFRQFYINGNRGVRAKSQYLYWPKATYNDGISNYVNNTIDGFIVDGNVFEGEFSKPKDLEFVWMPSWKNIRIPLDSIERTQEGDYIFKFLQPYFDATLLKNGDGMPKPSIDTPFYIENAVEFLDEPGEWYFNKDKKTIYYYPHAEENMDTAECFIPTLEKLVSLKGNSGNEKIENITFKNIRFSYAGWTEPNEKGFITHQAELLIAPDATVQNPTSYPSKMMPASIEVQYADSINFENNEFSHLGSVALTLSKMTKNCNIKGNIFDDLSASAVTFGDHNFSKITPKDEICTKIIIADNLIRRTSVEYQTPIITGYYVGESSIRNNDIKDAPYTGISLGWGWGANVDNCRFNDIIGNRIENVMHKLVDGSHIYTLGKQPGTVISDNYLLKSGDYHGGIYHDNASENITVRDNVFEECPKWVRMLYNNVKNNVGKNNYSDTMGSIDEKNQYDVAFGKVNGGWPIDAQNIIRRAGLTENYSHLYDIYEKKSVNYRDDSLKWLKYDTDPGINVPAGDYMEGGLGVAYHDISEVPGGYSAPYEPGVVLVGSGVNHKYITMTGQGEWTKYKVEIPENAEYEFFLTFVSLGYQYADVYIDDQLVSDNVYLQKSANNYNDIMHTLKEQKLFEIPLTKGEHTVKIEHARSNFVPYKFRLTKVGDVWQGRNDGFDTNIINAVIK